MKCESAPDLAYYDTQYFGGVGTTIVRSYPTMYMPPKKGPHLMGLDVYLEDDFNPPILSSSATNLSLLTEFYETPNGGTDWRLAYTVDLRRTGANYFAGFGNIKSQRRTTNAPQFSFKQWHRIEILATNDRKLTLFQDGKVVEVGELKDEAEVATAGGHPGLYALSSRASQQAPFTSGTLYNDNWSIVVWPP